MKHEMDSGITAETRSPREGAIRFDRNELAGAFGDIGTDLPLLVAMIAVAKLDAASVLIVYGAMQILTALVYRMPMPVQPLKAMAALVISQKLGGDLLYGGGLAIGIVMLLLSSAGLIDLLARVIPKTVVRGIQFGLGLQLALLAAREFIPAGGTAGFVVAGVGFALTVALIGNRRYPAALFVIALGILYALLFKMNPAVLAQGFGFALPHFKVPSPHYIWLGFLVLGLPQIPLSLGNSILATRQLGEDLFPERNLTVRKIGFTYSLMNLVNPFFGGVPTCHGSGGMAGHYAFGGRTGGSVIIYGCFYLILGLLFSPGFAQIIQVFPKPILGVLLFFEGLTLMRLLSDLADEKTGFGIAIAVGLMAAGLPFGYVVAMIAGTALVYLSRIGRFSLDK